MLSVDLVLIDPGRCPFGLRNDLLWMSRGACPAVGRIPKEAWLEIQRGSTKVARAGSRSGMRSSKSRPK